jgi:hypothetical protein
MWVRRALTLAGANITRPLSPLLISIPSCKRSEPCRNAKGSCYFHAIEVAFVSNMPAPKWAHPPGLDWPRWAAAVAVAVITVRATLRACISPLQTDDPAHSVLPILVLLLVPTPAFPSAVPLSPCLCPSTASICWRPWQPWVLPPHPPDKVPPTSRVPARFLLCLRLLQASAAMAAVQYGPWEAQMAPPLALHRRRLTTQPCQTMVHIQGP